MLMMMRADDDYTPATRGCTAEELLACVTADDYDACIAACSDAEEPVITGNGYVKVTKSGTTETQKVARNAVNKKIGSIKLTAGEYDTTVNSIVVAHSGLGTSSDVAIQLYKDGVAVSSAKKITKSSQEVTVKFSPSVTIKAGKNETFDIMASLSGNTNETHNFSVTAVNVANGTAEGTPITLGSLETTSYTVGDVNVKFTNLATSFEAGDTDKKVFTVDLTPSTNSTIKGLTISKDDASTLDLDEMFSKVEAYYNNEKVGTVTLTSDKITISDLNIVRTSGKVSITLKADCMYVGKAGTGIMYVAENDVLATEASTSENMRSNSTKDNSTNKTAVITVAGVDMTLKNMVTKANKAAKGDDLVELLNVKLSTDTSFELSKFTITGTLTTATAFEQVFETGSALTVYINGDEYDDFTVGALTGTFDDDAFSVDSKNPLTIQVYGTINSEALENASVKFSLSVDQIKNEDGDKITVTSVKPVVGHTTQVTSASVTAKKTQNIPNSKTLKEGTDTTWLYFDLKASTTDFEISDQTGLYISFNKTLGALSGFTDEVRLMQGKNEVATLDLTTLDSTGAAKTGFAFKFDQTISKDSTLSFTLEATLKDGIVVNIGEKIKATLEKVNDTSVSVPGTEYAISSDLPKVVLSDRNAEYTTISFENTSSYDDVYVTGFTVKVSSVIGNLPKDMTTFAATLHLLDGINGTALSASSGSVPGTVTVVLNGSGMRVGDEGFIQLDNTIGLQGNWYTVEITSVTFQYYDEDDKLTTAITENYSESL